MKLRILSFSLAAAAILITAVLLYTQDRPSRQSVVATTDFNNKIQRAGEITIRFVSGIHSGGNELVIVSNNEVSQITDSIAAADVLGETQGIHYSAPIASDEHWELLFFREGTNIAKADMFFGEYVYFQDGCEYGVRLTNRGKLCVFNVIHKLRRDGNPSRSRQQ